MKRLPPLPFVLVLLTLLATGAGNPPPIVKGLAELNVAHGAADRALMGVTEYFHWGEWCGGAGGCTNMNRNWTLPQATCYPVLLLGNEPTNAEPAGHPITATLAASVTVSIEQACPAMRLVAANIHLNNGGGEAVQWLTDYLAAYQLKAGHAYTGTLGVHCYSQWADTCLAHLRALAALPFAGKFWLTEFGIYGAAPYVNSGAELAKFLTGLPLALPGRIERAYIWTNRSDPNCCVGWPFELVHADGTLTPMGVVWANWQPPSVRQTWLPALNPGTAAYP